MKLRNRLAIRLLLVIVAVAIPWSTAIAARSSTAAGSISDGQLQRALDLIHDGQFSAAADTLEHLDASVGEVERIRGWLKDFLARQDARKQLDRAEFETYVGYAKTRIERKEWTLALDKTWLAADVSADRDAFLQDGWVRELVKESLSHAEECRRKADWDCAWEIYGRLSALYERETLYQRLEREAITHLRLETMFKDANWKDRLDRVRWEDAEDALQYLHQYYVEVVDFKKLTEAGLEQVLLLAESKAAQDAVEGLRNEDDRKDFVRRLRAHLEPVRASPSMDLKECIDRFRRVVRDINKQTVKMPEELLVSELTRGAMDTLDEFTTILWPKEIEEFDKHTRGNFIGVGIQIIKNRTNEIEVVTPLDDTPAYRAGIRAGDLITHVDGTPLRDVTLNKVVEMITGQKGTEVTLTVRRDAKDLSYKLQRDEVKIQSVKGVRRDQERDGKWNHWLDPDRGIAYVRVTNFQKQTVEDVDNILRDLQGQGMKALVFDLRGNPGGLLESAWQMSTLFLKRNEDVVSTKGRIPDENHQFEAKTDGPYADLPLVVLVDESSASASEIVSGSIRDNGRGLVIGARTFGKFSVQNLIPLSHSKAKLKITTASYFLPSGASLHRKPDSEKWGVEPSIPIRLVRWERSNVWQLRRDADLLGPPPPKSELTPADEDEEEEVTGPPSGPKVEDPFWVGPDPDGSLPPLSQPDINRRPKEDPQLDTALLVLRASLLGKTSPSLAAAEKPVKDDSARP